MQSGIDSSRARIASELANQADNSQPTQTAANASPGFFNEGGPSFRDVLDAINPLNHIPVVSDILENVTGHHVSTAANLAGGALLGGGIGFVASLATEIFSSIAGSSPAKAVYAALTGDDTTQVASTAETADAPEQLASLEPASTAEAALAAPVADVESRDLEGSVGGGRRQAVLDLFGGSDASAHNSYKKAQLLPYLRDVNHSKII